MIMFAEIYYGGMYGGAISSILLNTPGETALIMTALGGNRMAKRGRGGKALGAAHHGSFFGEMFATLGLALVASFMVLVLVVLSFGTAKYFPLMVLSFWTVSAGFGRSVWRGLIALFIGLTIGIDKLTVEVRLAFGIPEMSDTSRSPSSPSAISRLAKRFISRRNTPMTRRRRFRCRSG
jgi:putative tricarboxylic transport membrane protein